MIAELALPRHIADFETRSILSVTDCGAWRYAEEPKTEIICLGYQMAGQEEPKVWVPDEEFPEELIEAIKKGEAIECHNAAFEKAIWHYKLTKLFNIPYPKVWVDTMATCAYRAIPLALEGAGEAIELDVQKDKRGSYLIQQLCKPRKPRKKEEAEFIKQGLTPEQYPIIYRNDEELRNELIYQYCPRDVSAENALGNKLGDLPAAEYRVWELDQKINERGMAVDIEAIKGALKIMEVVEEKALDEMFALTGGEILSGNEVGRIKEWLKENGMLVQTLDAKNVEKLVNDPKTPSQCVEILKLRQILSKASTKKLRKMLQTVNSDGRIRGMMQYHGASTGRWAGRLSQPQNLPKGFLERYVKELKEEPSDIMEKLISIIKKGNTDPDEAVLLLEEKYGSAMDALVTSIRGMFIADKGKKLYVADFSAIEAVVLACLAGEEWKVEAFRAIQKGEKYKGADDIYCATASQIFGKTVNKKENKEERGVGKVCELAFGYQGGLGAWIKFDSSGKYTSDEINDFKKQWRERHKRIEKFWYGIQDAAIGAVDRPGSETEFMGIKFKMVTDKAGDWLMCILPSGRKLWYYGPFTVMEPMPWNEKDLRPTLYYEGKDSKKQGAWSVISSYGGMLVENVVQAVARDIMVSAMFRLEAAGYPVLLTVHDEIIAETDENFGSLDEFISIMSERPKWDKGYNFPIGVDGWEGTRYRKE